MKQAISPDLFQSFAAGLPIVRECKLDSDKVATLKLQNDDEIKLFISYSAEDIRRAVVEFAHEQSSANFMLDGRGDVVISSEKEGILAAVPEIVMLG